jgi:segregation and condensation protein B
MMAEEHEEETAEAEPENGTAEIEPEEDPEAAEEVETLGREESRQALYALLFVSDRPLSAKRLAEALGDMDPDIVATLLEELREEIEAQEMLPYRLHEVGGGYQFMTKAEFAPYIRRLFQIRKSNRLSRALLETLSIIAWKQPVTRAEVEAIRGVSVSYAFDQLMEKRLIKISGVADLPGRPKQYRTTDEFLMQFGLGSLKELPSLEELQDLG